MDHECQTLHREEISIKARLSNSSGDATMLKMMSIVLADWCPHCVPLSLDIAKKVAENLGIELRVLDIDDPEQEKAADKLVKDYGDDAEDYLIPQVFLEDDAGHIQHFFTGFSEGVSITKARWDDLLASNFYQELLKQQGKS
jgi:glutaredoxin